MYIGVRRRFESLSDNLKLKDTQIDDGQNKHRSITRVLNSAYYGTNSESDHRILAGSWAKHTRMRPPRDIDMLFVLPVETYNRFELRQGNKQSQLLQEVKGILLNAYGNSDIRGDGPVVFVNFTTFRVEVVPAFLLQNGQYWICNTSNGGSYKITDPKADCLNMTTENSNSNGNVRHLIKMMKCWQRECNVPIKSFMIELTAINFMKNWSNKQQGFSHHDFMARDYFSYLISQSNSYVITPGTNELIWLGNSWLSRAQTALARSESAVTYEALDKVSEAGDEWQKIFGTYIPKYV